MADSDIFRVKIDLGNYFSDHKSKAYVSVNRQWKNVRQFHRHITEIFDVKKFVLLTNDGVYLPAKEHIGIIQHGDIIHVIAKQDDCESVISAATEAMAIVTEQTNSKHVNTADGNPFKVPHRVSTSNGLGSGQNTSDFTAGEDECADSVGTNDTNSSKRKRVRHRKRKNKPVENDENQMNVPNLQASSATTTTGGPSKYDTIEKSLRVTATTKSNTHVRFEDDESLSELDEEIILPKTARVIRANVIEVTNVKNDTIPNMDVDVCEVNTASETLAPAQQMNGNAVENGNGVEVEPSDKEEPALEQLAKNLETMGKYRDLDNDIKEMDMLAFKVFTPSFQKSDYVIGLVETIIGKDNVEQQDYDLALQIMAGSAHIAHLNESAEDNIANIRIQINRMDIFDAKILAL